MNIFLFVIKKRGLGVYVGNYIYTSVTNKINTTSKIWK